MRKELEVDDDTWRMKCESDAQWAIDHLSMEKESLVDLLMSVQTGHCSCRRAATEIIELHKKELAALSKS